MSKQETILFWLDGITQARIRRNLNWEGGFSQEDIEACIRLWRLVGQTFGVSGWERVFSQLTLNNCHMALFRLYRKDKEEVTRFCENLDPDNILIGASVMIPYEDMYVLIRERPEKKYGMIGGKIEKKEDYDEGLFREIIEEIGVNSTSLSIVKEMGDRPIISVDIDCKAKRIAVCFAHVVDYHRVHRPLERKDMALKKIGDRDVERWVDRVDKHIKLWNEHAKDYWKSVLRVTPPMECLWILSEI